MAGSTNYPAALDNGTTLPQPGSGDLVSVVDHAALHDNVDVAIIATQTKLGIGASTPITSRLLRGTGTGTSAWAQAILTTDVTGTLPVANGGTGVTGSTGTGNTVLSNSPTLSAPIFTTISNTGTLTLPTTTDTLVGRATTDTLTNKSMDGGSNTFTNIPVSSIATTSGSWATWTPSFVNLTIGNGTINGRYTQIGKSIFVNLLITLGSTSSVGSTVTFTLPVTGSANYIYGSANGTTFATAYYLQPSTQSFTGLIRMNTNTIAQFIVSGVSGSFINTTGITSGVPFTWATGNQFMATFSYEAA